MDKDKCTGCNNSKGCVTCVDGSEWAHYHYEEPVSEVWNDVSRETPTGFGKAIIVICRNKNMEDGIWLADLIQDWEGEWEPRTNWETPVKWAYVKDLINLTLSEATNMGEQEPVSDELEEAAIEECSKLLKDETVIIDGYEYVVLSDAEECFKAGAKWQKKQDDKLLQDHVVYKKGKESGMRYMKQLMMKNAVEGMVEEPESLWWRIISDDLEGEFVVKNNLHDEDRVKMIIIKEE